MLIIPQLSPSALLSLSFNQDEFACLHDNTLGNIVTSPVLTMLNQTSY